MNAISYNALRAAIVFARELSAGSVKGEPIDRARDLSVQFDASPEDVDASLVAVQVYEIGSLLAALVAA